MTKQLLCAFYIVFFILGSLNALAEHIIEATDNNGNPIKALQVGDKVPNILLQNIMNYSSSQVSFHDIKKRLILLDFWGTTCSSCVGFLPTLDSLQRLFSKSLQIFTITNFDTKEKVLTTLERLKIKRSITLPVILNDAKLNKYFPHELVSHIAWIKDGEVIAITGSEYVNVVNIQQALEGSVNWPVKNDQIGFDYNKPLLTFTSDISIHPKPIYYSFFTGSIPGVDSKTGVYIDSVSQTVTYTYYNVPLLNFCVGALDGSPIGYPSKNDVILEVKDKQKIFFLKTDSSQYYNAWARDNTYCYSFCIQYDSSISNISEKNFIGGLARALLLDVKTSSFIKQDLTKWIRLHGYKISKENKLVDYLSLESGPEILPPLREEVEAAEKNKLHEIRITQLRNISIPFLIGFLNNNLPEFPNIINNSKIPDEYTIDFMFELSKKIDLTQINKQLENYGLKLIPRKRAKEVYVISDGSH